MDNSPRYYEVLWAAQRSGLRFTCISSKLTAGEVEYIVKDCGPRRSSPRPGVRRGGAAAGAADPRRRAVHGRRRRARRIESFEAARAAMPDHADRRRERRRRPCSIRPAPPAGPRASSARAPADSGPIDAPNGLAMMGQALYGWTPDSIYLSPAPLYHAAPLGWSMARAGAGRHGDPDGAFRRRGGAAPDREVQGDHAPSGCRPISSVC